MKHYSIVACLMILTIWKVASSNKPIGLPEIINKSGLHKLTNDELKFLKKILQLGSHSVHEATVVDGSKETRRNSLTSQNAKMVQLKQSLNQPTAVLAMLMGKHQARNRSAKLYEFIQQKLKNVP